MPTNMTVFKSP